MSTPNTGHCSVSEKYETFSSRPRSRRTRQIRHCPRLLLCHVPQEIHDRPLRNQIEQAISTQNYFFLRLAAGSETPEIIVDELEGFVERLENEIDTLKPNIKTKIKNEIEEGGYFDNKSAKQITRMLNGATARITGMTMQTITDFCHAMWTEIQTENGVVLREEFNQQSVND